ncbi:GNAT family N-acetyltransferase [Nocardia puris]|uniref:GNAT family N-acetyltransferase n=1 Tax=Nocardia TaxID=1817 RepID=UPI0004A7618E|nr:MULTISPECIES: GNAT family N-acetyltransferase [Nocardia]MBF6137231.1 GNAT family N-acetyltransferase [Nocardia otitidiscaviarum]MBF6181835.1 GNAT family N-acetyltransferase [Nocardia otitidiscaviarum]MBF6461728.1 GNAT family N-acetyltransferase [Nocardia puris]MBF6488128.1 GNAT family N-acetyltransferase [Nocardia otitidiscaviarum]
MIIAPLQPKHISDIHQLMERGEPYVHARNLSDYWLYAALFSSTCPIATDGDSIVGAVIAFRSQDNPADVYLQDVMVHPQHQRRGIARALLDSVRSQAETWECERIYLTSEPDNEAAHVTWTALGFTNVPGDHEINGVSVITDFKGPGRNRAVFELTLTGK